MTFASTIEGVKALGSIKVSYGTYTNTDSGTGGAIDSGLSTCAYFKVQPGGSSVVASAPVVNATLPAAGSAITIVTTSNETGFWSALGW